MTDQNRQNAEAEGVMMTPEELQRTKFMRQLFSTLLAYTGIKYGPEDPIFPLIVSLTLVSKDVLKDVREQDRRHLDKLFSETRKKDAENWREIADRLNSAIENNVKPPEDREYFLKMMLCLTGGLFAGFFLGMIFYRYFM